MDVYLSAKNDKRSSNTSKRGNMLFSIFDVKDMGKIKLYIGYKIS